MTLDWFLLELFGCVYFYAISLSESDSDPRPSIFVGQATVVAWPFCNLSYLPDQAYSASIAIAFGTFIAPLLISAPVEPGAEDVGSIFHFLWKWLIGWIYLTIMMAVITFVLDKLSYFALVDHAITSLSNVIIPTISNSPNENFFHSLVEKAIPIVMVFGMCRRLIAIRQRSTVSAAIFCPAIAVIIMSFLYLVNHGAVANRHLGISGLIGGGLGAAIIMDLMVALTKARVEMGRGFEPPF